MSSEFSPINRAVNEAIEDLRPTAPLFFHEAIDYGEAVLRKVINDYLGEVLAVEEVKSVRFGVDGRVLKVLSILDWFPELADEVNFVHLIDSSPYTRVAWKLHRAADNVRSSNRNTLWMGGLYVNFCSRDSFSGYKDEEIFKEVWGLENSAGIDLYPLRLK